LVTGAAGFIGSAVMALLRESGHEVVALDAFIAQAHRDTGHFRDDVMRLDVRDEDALSGVLSGVDLVCHQAAMVGSGISAADLPEFARHNDLATATLLSAMATRHVAHLVLASSMVVYGDGRYTCSTHGERASTRRSLEDLREGRFDVRCPECGLAMSWGAVDENAPLSPRSGYAASKVAQEHYAAAWARQTGGRVVALRYHNVYGPGMPANTPYSGVAAMFRSALEQGQTPRVYEDGAQMRDFVHVHDVARANLHAIARCLADEPDSFAAYNVCSGTPISIGQVARYVCAGLSMDRRPVVTGEFRPGDVRHIVASPLKALTQLGFHALVEPADGLARFARDPLRGGTPTTP
jgi:dTDP-L-rhamnose 4-epimerase